MRFIFIRKSNGSIPAHFVPPSFSTKDKETDQKKGELDLKLVSHQRQREYSPKGRGVGEGHFPFELFGAVSTRKCASQLLRENSLGVLASRYFRGRRLSFDSTSTV